MIKIIPPFLVLLTVGISSAQSTQGVLKEKRHELPDCTVIVQCVHPQAPPLPPKPRVKVDRERVFYNPPQPYESTGSKHAHFAVSATIYASNRTLFRWAWLQDGQRQIYEGWANINGAILGGTSAFKGEDGTDYFLLLTAGHAQDPLPGSCPKFKEESHFVLTMGPEENGPAVIAMRSLLKYYRENHASLIERHQERQQKLIKKNADPKERPEVTIKYWKVDRSAGRGGRR